MQAPTITVDELRERSRHDRISGSASDVGNWSDDIIEMLRDATAGVLERYVNSWNWSATNAIASYKAAFYLLFDNIAFRSERGGAFNSERMGAYSYSMNKDKLPPVVRSIVESFSGDAPGFSAGRFHRTGRSRR